MTTQVAFLFPGQGSQAVGMGADVYETSAAAKRVFAAADAAVHMSLSDLCFHGPEDILRETINAQPAIVAVSLAFLAAFQEALASSVISSSSESSWSTPLTPRYTAGHSVGEYTALVAANALELESAATLVRERGRLMHHEGTVCPGSMAAVIGMDAKTLQAICEEASQQMQQEHSTMGTSLSHPGIGQVAIANYNAPGQIVISGENSALARASELATARGARRVIPLSVSGAFHSPVMQPAVPGLAQAVNTAHVHEATIPVIGNISATPLTTVQEIQEELTQQVATSVQWIRTIAYMAQNGVTVFIEIGPGQALTGMVKRIVKGATIVNIGTVAELKKAVTQVRDIGLLHDV